MRDEFPHCGTDKGHLIFLQTENKNVICLDLFIIYLGSMYIYVEDKALIVKM